MDKVQFTEHGVLGEHATSGPAYRMLIPWSRIYQVWQDQ